MGRSSIHRSHPNGIVDCKIWYSICRTMSDYHVLCVNVNDRSVRAIAVKLAAS
jgi:hypothetical protein